MKKRPYFALFALLTGAALLTSYAAQGQQQSCRAACGPQATAGCPCPPQAACVPPQAACCTTQGVCCAVACPQPSCTPVSARCCCAATAPENAKLVEELRGLLQETSSRDTFLVTVKALSDIGPSAKMAVPAIIRGAERLKLSKDIEQQVSEEKGAGAMIVECIERILTSPGCEARCAAGVFTIRAPAVVPPPPMFAVPGCLAAPGCLPCPAMSPLRAPSTFEVPTSAEPIPPPSIR